ncbi:HIT-like protein [Karstenula rhodostoma CBS 690.94]|uniref:Aprataxin-like protein n=1 Tax=Karstenula rhodostoma CBS 690.94 TaxID=1392251 RepID=A0A9P4P8Q9_9PLEO|nr:HIT-like protein [Karstenula rhodostoma CBS 690.94]
MASKGPVIRADDAPDEAITGEEIIGDAVPQVSAGSGTPTAHQSRNAFAELMSKSKPSAKAVTGNTNKGKPWSRTSSSPKNFDGRDGLGIYIQHPERNPEGRVIDYDDEFVVIQDKFPKASVHLLLLPRDPSLTLEHPLVTLSNNPAFLAKLKPRVERLKLLAARELRRKYGLSSAADAPYQRALEDLMSGPDPPLPAERDSLLPQGRDWSREIISGVHTHPSMNHLHIHVLSRDMHSPWLKKKNHYLSFNSSFLVGLDEFPLEEGSPRFHPGDWPSWDMKCWRCEKNFGNKFKPLQEHLDDEFDEWKKV